jgi:hypothetical protein
MPTYDVRASLTMAAKNAGALKQSARDARQLAAELRGGSNAARQMFGQMLALGGAYAGVRLLTSAFRGLVGSAVSYTSELERTKIGLQSVISAVEEIPWEEAGRRGEAAFKRVREMAILSPATSKEMFDIFQGIVGPIERAGFSMNKVLSITNDTVLAASALGVDYAQASRDINMMARGTAGMEVKMFSMLRSTGAIAEDAETWNKLLPAQRVEKLSAALKKFASSGKAFGSSWAGVTSTFKDLVDNFKQAAFAPIMKVLGRNLEKFNGYILEHRTELEAFFQRVGTDIGFWLQHAIDRGKQGFTWITDNWGLIIDKFDRVVAGTKEIAPIIAKAALAWQGVQLTRDIAGAGMQAGSALSSLAASAAGTAGGAFAARGASAAEVTTGVTRMFQLEGATGGFTEAMLAGGGAAAAGGGGGAGAAAAGTMATLGVGLAIFAAVLAAVAGVVLVVRENWEAFKTTFLDSTLQLGELLVGLGKALWKFLAPALKVIGHIILAVLGPAWILLSTLLKGVVVVLTVVFDILGSITETIYNTLQPAFRFVQDGIASIAKTFTDLFGYLLDEKESVDREFKKARYEAAWGPGGSQVGLPTDPGTNWDRWNPALSGPIKTLDQVDLSKVPKAGMNVTNDFRGSRIQVKQEFKGDTDPDRVVQAMVHDLTRQAEQRISSGMAGAFTR